ncbi:class I SAM-dependent methyltransferase [Actinophytocola sediminis]
MGTLRWLAHTSQRVGLCRMAWSDRPDRGLVAHVEGSPPPTPGRALDLGCAVGRNTVYLAARGWATTGVELTARDLDTARRRADEAGVAPRLVPGDVTRLADLDIGDGYELLFDGGCLHMIPANRRDAYAASVTRVAAPGAVLLLVGFAPLRLTGAGVTADELRARLSGWELTDAQPVPGEEMAETLPGASPLRRRALLRGWLRATRYRLERR